MRKALVAFGLVVLLSVLACGSAQAKPPILKVGDKVKIVGIGYYNPDCYGKAGFWWDFFNQKEYFATCLVKTVPQGGTGTITGGDIGSRRNGCNRVCNQYGKCGWYPDSALKKDK